MITLIFAVVSLLGATPAIAATEPPTESPIVAAAAAGPAPAPTGDPVLWHARDGLGIRSAVAWPAQAGISVASAAASGGMAFQPALPPPEPQPAPPPATPGDAAGEASPSIPPEPSFPSEYDIVPPSSPDTPGAAPGPGAAGVGSSCGLWDLGACINDWLRGAITEALNPGLELLSGTLLTTPTLEQMPRVAELWSRSWQILLACYGMLIMAAGVILMTHETLQTRYSLRELLPRLIVGFLAGAVSLVLAGMAIDIANALSAAVMAGGTDPDAGADVLADLLLGVVTNDGGLFLLLAAVVVTVMLIALLLVWVVRVVVTILLIAGAPIALMLHALPHTEGVARWWWRSFAGVLAIQVLQSLVLATAVQVLLNDGGQLTTTIFGASTTTSTGWINILVSLTLLWILWKIPFWVLGTINGHGGRSFLGSALRTFLAYKTFGLVRGATSTLLTRSGSGESGKPGGGAAGPGDPYAVERATRDGQLMLPLPGLRRGRRNRAPAATLARHTTGRHATGRGGEPAVGRQLELPLSEGDWPENRPRLGSDGQYRLPFPVTRVPRPTPPPPAAAPTAESGPESGPPRGRQLRFPTAGDWPENRPRLGRDGQYQFPYPVTRAPRPTPPPHAPTPSAPPPRPPAGRQLRFPTTGDWPENRPRLGPDGQYRFPYPLTRAPRPAPPPTTPPPRRTTRPTTGPEAGPGVGVPRGEQLPMFDLPSDPAPSTPTPATPPPDTSNPPPPASDPGPSPTPLPAVTPPVTPAVSPPGGPVGGRGPRKPRCPRRRPS